MSTKQLIIAGITITIILVGGTVTAYYMGRRAGVKRSLNDKVETMIGNAIDGIKPGLEKALDGAIGKTIDSLKADIQPFLLDACGTKAKAKPAAA